MMKFFYIQMRSGASAPVLIALSSVLGIRRSSDTEAKIDVTSGYSTEDTISLLHADDSASTLKMQAWLVEEMRKLLSTPATDVAPLLIPPVEVTTYAIA
jgi:hypothetical protein